MKNIFAILCIVIAAAALTASGCSRKGSAPESASKGAEATGTGSIQIKGSDTMVNVGQAWAEAFMKKNPGAGVSITGGGSGTGIAALINGTTDIAESSRAFKPEEMEQAKQNGANPVEFIVGYDGLAVVAHPSNPVSSLTISQLADIFSGKITDWSEVGGRKGKIVVLSREVNSGTHVYFKEHVLNGGDSKGGVEFAGGALLMPSSQAIADEVAQNRSAIGYYGMGYLSPKQKALKVAAAEGAAPVVPTPENVLSKAYPVSRPLFMYTNGDPNGLVKEFVAFALSPEGQKIVADLDFVPVK